MLWCFSVNWDRVRSLRTFLFVLFWNLVLGAAFLWYGHGAGNCWAFLWLKWNLRGGLLRLLILGFFGLLFWAWLVCLGVCGQCLLLRGFVLALFVLLSHLLQELFDFQLQLWHLDEVLLFQRAPGERIRFIIEQVLADGESVHDLV